MNNAEDANFCKLVQQTNEECLQHIKSEDDLSKPECIENISQHSFRSKHNRIPVSARCSRSNADVASNTGIAMPREGNDDVVCDDNDDTSKTQYFTDNFTALKNAIYNELPSQHTLRLEGTGNGDSCCATEPDNICGESSQKSLLFCHKLNEDLDAVKTEEFIGADSLPNKWYSNRNPGFACKLCNKRFHLPRTLESHMKTHVGQNNVAGKDSLDSRRAPRRNVVRCPICQKPYSTRNRLKNHMLVHIEQFICVICKKEFSRGGYLKAHMLTHDVRRFKCTICFKEFIYKSGLKKHLLLHESTKRHKCTICAKEFTYESILQNHMDSHAGLKPFSCTICGNKFGRKGSLTKHLLLHVGVKPFKCQHCTKDFIYKGDLRKHMMVHSNFKQFRCTLCSKEFVRKDNLSVHMLTHAESKPFKCTVCKKAFAGKGRLDIHLMTHSTLKPFMCEICTKTFKGKLTLSRHKLICKGSVV